MKSVSESTADGGSNVVTFSDGKTVTIKNGSKGSAGANGSNGADGVSVSSVKQTTTSTADGGSNVVTVTLSNGTTSTFTVKNGSKGSTGSAGKTPVKGTDYFTEADKEEIVQQVITALGTPVFGTVDADNNIILTGELADGTYTVKYEDADGNVIDVGTISNIETSGTIPIEWGLGQINRDTGAITTTTGNEGCQHVHTQLIPFESGKKYSAVGINEGACGGYRVIYYTADGGYLGYGDDTKFGDTGVAWAGEKEIPVLYNAGAFRLRFYNLFYNNSYTNCFELNKKNFAISWSVV